MAEQRTIHFELKTAIQECRIKSNPKTNHIIVIMLSAKDEVESEMEGYKTGANVYLSKPFLPQKLLLSDKLQIPF